MIFALIDDSKEDREKLHTLLTEYAAHHSGELILRCFSSGEKFLEKYRPCQYAAVFLDIYMGGITGLETAIAGQRVCEQNQHKKADAQVKQVDIQPCNKGGCLRISDSIITIGKIGGKAQQCTDKHKNGKGLTESSAHRKMKQNKE